MAPSANPALNIGMNIAPPPVEVINELILNGDPATGNMATLAASINSVPFEPTYLGDIGLFEYDSESTSTIMLEFDGQSIELIKTSPPGSPAPATTLANRQTLTLVAPRLAERVVVNATEISQIRALASTSLDTVANRLNRKLQKAIRNIRTTLEFHRLAAAMGILLDADGSTIYSYFSQLGISQTSIDVTFGTPASAKFIGIGEQILNALEDALGNLASMGGRPPIVLAGRTFFARFTASADLVAAYQFFEAVGQKNIEGRDDTRYVDFEHGGIRWRQYRGGASNFGRFIPDAEAHVIIPGVPGTYMGYFCPPSDISDRAGQPGLPIDVTMEALDHKAGFEVRMQSNPLHVMARPAAAIKLYSSN